jgi:hypothetical protein
MRNQLLPLFPKDFVTMKSGRGFHEACNDVYVKAYHDEMAKMKHGLVLKYTKPEVDAMLPPHLLVGIQQNSLDFWIVYEKFSSRSSARAQCCRCVD